MDKVLEAKLLERDNLVMATMITEHFMKVLNCKDINELIEDCETIIEAAKQTRDHLAK